MRFRLWPCLCHICFEISQLRALFHLSSVCLSVLCLKNSLQVVMGNSIMSFYWRISMAMQLPSMSWCLGTQISDILCYLAISLRDLRHSIIIFELSTHDSNAFKYAGTRKLSNFATSAENTIPPPTWLFIFEPSVKILIVSANRWGCLSLFQRALLLRILYWSLISKHNSQLPLVVKHLSWWLSKRYYFCI